MKQAQDDVKNQTSEFLTYASEVWYFKYRKIASINARY